jgi:hypothetical protein
MFEFFFSVLEKRKEPWNRPFAPAGQKCSRHWPIRCGWNWWSCCVHGPVCVCELAARFPLGLPAISKHLSLLREAGVIQARRDGTKVIYSLVMPCMLDSFSCIDRLILSTTAGPGRTAPRRSKTEQLPHERHAFQPLAAGEAQLALGLSASTDGGLVAAAGIGTVPDRTGLRPRPGPLVHARTCDPLPAARLFHRRGHLRVHPQGCRAAAAGAWQRRAGWPTASPACPARCWPCAVARCCRCSRASTGGARGWGRPWRFCTRARPSMCWPSFSRPGSWVGNWAWPGPSEPWASV